MISIFGNNNQTTLAAAINSVATTFNVFPGTGAAFPHPAAGQYFVMTLTPAAGGSQNEIMWVTNVTGDVFTVLRGRENTTATNWLSGDFCSCFPTAGTQANFIQVDQYQNGAYLLATAGGTANALTATIVSNLTTIPNGMIALITASATNTAPATFQVTLGSTIQSAVPIYKLNKLPLLAGDIQNTSILSLIYNSTYGGWVLQNPTITQGGAIVGDSRGFAITNLTSATNNLTLTAVATALQSSGNLQSVVLNNYSQTINTSTIGAGGMDVGSPPTSGFVGIYLIYNPTTGAVSTVGTNANVLLTNTYSGANLPSGYTYSALVSVWPTDGSGHFIIGTQLDRAINFKYQLVFTTSTFPYSSATNVSSFVPLNGVSCSGLASLTPTTGSGQGTISVCDYYTGTNVSNAIGANTLTSYAQTTSPAQSIINTFKDVRTNNTQSVFFISIDSQITPPITAATSQLNIWGYTI